MIASRPRYPADTQLTIAVLVLAVFGLIMISSVSVYESHQVYTRLGVDCGQMDVNCNDFYFWRQARNIAIAIPIWLAAAATPYLFWRRWALPGFIFGLLALFALFIPGVATEFGTSRSWVSIPILGSVQPAEFVKIAMIFYFARWMERRSQEIATIEGGFVPFAIILGLVVLPLALQPDFGSILVCSVIATAIYFAAGARAQHIFGGAAIAGLFGFLAVNLLDLGYIKNRFMAFLDPTLDPEGIGFQVKQSLIAVGKGGFFGQGMEGATQRFGYLPEAQSDAMFAAIAEAFGFFGSILVAGAFLFIAYRGLKIAAGAPDRFAKLVAVGLSAALAGQAFIHIGVNIAILPLTGLTLPFISYGGTSLFVSFAMAGILLNISRYSNIREPESYRAQRGK